jgi:PAS domain S-box-containing protein
LNLDHVLQLGGENQLVQFKEMLHQAVREKQSNFSYYLDHYDTEKGEMISHHLNVVISYDKKNNVATFLGYIIDATEQRKTERLRELRAVFNAIFLSNRSIDQCLEQVLGHIVHFSPDFRIAECWLPNYDGSKIRRRSAYSRFGLLKDPFLMDINSLLEFARNEGLPGFCMEKKEIIWWNTLIENENFKRRDLLRTCNLDTGIAIPLLINAELVAVITLFSETPLEKTISGVNQLIGISESIGHGIVGKRIAHQRDLLNDSSAILLFNTGPSGEILQANATAERLFSWKSKSEKINFFELLHRDERELFRQQWEELIGRKRSLISTIVKIIKGDGRAGALKVNATKCADDDSAYIVALDISRENELLHLLSLSNRMASIGFWTIDLLNKETILSGNARILLGIPEDTVISDLTMSFMKKLMPDNLFDEMSHSLLENEVSLDLKWERVVEKNSRQFRLIVKSEFNNGQCARLSGVIQDITKIVKTEEALENAKSNYLDLIDLSPIPIWLCNFENSKIELANKTACETYGYTSEEFEQINFDQVLLKEGQLNSIKMQAADLNKGDEAYMGNFRHCTKDGKELRMDVFARRIEFQDTDYLLLIGVDRTESIEFQNEISRAVIRAQEGQKEDISRELHDNICQLMVTSQLYLSLLKEQDDNTDKNYLDQAMNLLEKANKETRQLSHALSSQKFLRQTLEESIDEVIHSFQLTKKIKVKKNFEPNLLSCNNEREEELKLHLVRLVQEAISNTVKHSEAGELDIIGGRQDEQLILTIQDNGKGFDERTVKHGIGLYNMQNRVQICQGEMHISSAPGEGTKLQIRIPV